MDNKKLLVLLAILCIISAAGVACVSATDSGSNGHDTRSIGESQYDHVVIGDGNSTAHAGNAGVLEPGLGLPLKNQTAPAIGNATGNATANVTGNATVPATHNATGNATHTIHRMPSTGNPLISLLGVTAILGGACVVATRKK